MVDESGRVTNRATMFELLDKDGNSHGFAASAQALGDLARRLWPDQEQDEERTGKGWDVQVVGS